MNRIVECIFLSNKLWIFQVETKETGKRPTRSWLYWSHSMPEQHRLIKKNHPKRYQHIRTLTWTIRTYKAKLNEWKRKVVQAKAFKTNSSSVSLKIGKWWTFAWLIFFLLEYFVLFSHGSKLRIWEANVFYFSFSSIILNFICNFLQFFEFVLIFSASLVNTCEYIC